MKPFDLEAAMRGDPVVTRNGRSYKFGAYNSDANTNQRLIGWVDRVCVSYPESGVYIEGDETQLDLFMAPKKQRRWIRWYRTSTGKIDCVLYDVEGSFYSLHPDKEWLTEVLPCGEWEE